MPGRASRPKVEIIGNKTLVVPNGRLYNRTWSGSDSLSSLGSPVKDGNVGNLEPSVRLSTEGVRRHQSLEQTLDYQKDSGALSSSGAPRYSR